MPVQHKNSKDTTPALGYGTVKAFCFGLNLATKRFMATFDVATVVVKNTDGSKTLCGGGDTVVMSKWIWLREVNQLYQTFNSLASMFTNLCQMHTPSYVHRSCSSNYQIELIVFRQKFHTFALSLESL